MEVIILMQATYEIPGTKIKKARTHILIIIIIII